MALTRKEFCGGAFALVAGMAAPGLARAGQSSRRWYKGMIHCHTYWSDGRGFPEQAARAYRDAGYNFLCISDHNRIGMRRDEWRDVFEEEGTWPPKVNRRTFETYRKEFVDADVRTKDGKTQVRLKSFDEVKAKFERPGRFLMMPGMEITRTTCHADWKQNLHVHMNYLNLDCGLPSAEKGELIQGYGKTASEIIGKSLAEVKALASELGNPPHLFMVNHPHWRFFDLVPQDVIDHPDVRYFEICNCGAELERPRYMSRRDFSCDRFWDVVLAYRCRAKGHLLYGVGSDDAHWYPKSGATQDPMPFADAYIQVRADELTQAALIAAMDRGDFYASSGVDLEDVRFDVSSSRLILSIPAKRGVSYRVRFVGTKRDFKEGVEGEVLFPGNGSSCIGTRRLPIYSDTIGTTFKDVQGCPGERIEASYALADDDLYVRAVIESSEPAIPYALKGKCRPHVKMAWTQPYRRGL